MDTGVRLVTGDELLRLPRDQRVELVRGELVPRPPPPGGRHGGVTLKIGRVLADFVDQKSLGKVLVECGFYLARNPDTVRGPDVAFYPGLASVPDGYLEVAPAIAVEVASPGQSAAHLEEKVQDFLAAGVLLVWVFYPRTRTVHRFHPEGQAQVLKADDILSADQLLPEFRHPVSDFFEI